VDSWPNANNAIKYFQNENLAHKITKNNPTTANLNSTNTDPKDTLEDKNVDLDSNKIKLNSSEKPQYNLASSTSLCYKDPEKLITVLLGTNENSNISKSMRKCNLKFKTVLENNIKDGNETVSLAKSKFYLSKLESGIQKQESLNKAIKILTIDLNDMSEIPYIYSCINLKEKGLNT
jgi:hypothetical protein